MDQAGFMVEEAPGGYQWTAWWDTATGRWFELGHRATVEAAHAAGERRMRGMAEWGPEFDPMDYRTSPLYRDLKAIAEEYADPNAPAFIVTPTSGDPDDVKAAAIAGTIANSPEFVAEYERRRRHRMLYGF